MQNSFFGGDFEGRYGELADIGTASDNVCKAFSFVRVLLLKEVQRDPSISKQVVAKKANSLARERHPEL